MKAVVLEIKDGHAAVLCADGTVEKLRGAYVVGETVEVAERKAVPAWRKSLRAAVAAVALAGILGGGYSYQNVMAYSYVSLDIGETSLEYTLNRRDQVIAVSGLNGVSDAVADALSGELRRKSLPDALRQTVDYLGSGSDGEDGYALVSVTSGSDDRAEQLAGAVDQAMGPADSPVEFHAETASPQERKAAEEQGMSPGRYQIKQRAEDGDSRDFRNGDLDDLMGRGRPQAGQKTPPQSEASAGRPGGVSGSRQTGGQTPDTPAGSGAGSNAQTAPAQPAQPTQTPGAQSAPIQSDQAPGQSGQAAATPAASAPTQPQEPPAQTAPEQSAPAQGETARPESQEASDVPAQTPEERPAQPQDGPTGTESARESPEETGGVQPQPGGDDQRQEGGSAAETGERQEAGRTAAYDGQPQTGRQAGGAQRAGELPPLPQTRPGDAPA